jgi:hypothetical protein
MLKKMLDWLGGEPLLTALDSKLEKRNAEIKQVVERRLACLGNHPHVTEERLQELEEQCFYPYAAANYSGATFDVKRQDCLLEPIPIAKLRRGTMPEPSAGGRRRMEAPEGSASESCGRCRCRRGC